MIKNIEFLNDFKHPMGDYGSSIKHFRLINTDNVENKTYFSYEDIKKECIQDYSPTNLVVIGEEPFKYFSYFNFKVKKTKDFDFIVFEGVYYETIKSDKSLDLKDDTIPFADEFNDVIPFGVEDSFEPEYILKKADLEILAITEDEIRILEPLDSERLIAFESAKNIGALTSVIKETRFKHIDKVFRKINNKNVNRNILNVIENLEFNIENYEEEDYVDFSQRFVDKSDYNISNILKTLQKNEDLNYTKDLISHDPMLYNFFKRKDDFTTNEFKTIYRFNSLFYNTEKINKRLNKIYMAEKKDILGDNIDKSFLEVDDMNTLLKNLNLARIKEDIDDKFDLHLGLKDYQNFKDVYASTVLSLTKEHPDFALLMYLYIMFNFENYKKPSDTNVCSVGKGLTGLLKRGNELLTWDTEEVDFEKLYIEIMYNFSKMNNTLIDKNEGLLEESIDMISKVYNITLEESLRLMASFILTEGRIFFDYSYDSFFYAALATNDILYKNFFLEKKLNKEFNINTDKLNYKNNIFKQFYLLKLLEAFNLNLDNRHYDTKEKIETSCTITVNFEDYTKELKYRLIPFENIQEVINFGFENYIFLDNHLTLINDNLYDCYLYKIYDMDLNNVLGVLTYDIKKDKVVNLIDTSGEFISRV